MRRSRAFDWSTTGAPVAGSFLRKLLQSSFPPLGETDWSTGAEGGCDWCTSPMTGLEHDRGSRLATRGRRARLKNQNRAAAAPRLVAAAPNGCLQSSGQHLERSS